jgi:hypothetical protein
LFELVQLVLLDLAVGAFDLVEEGLGFLLEVLPGCFWGA